jgi:hypothetical protein
MTSIMYTRTYDADIESNMSENESSDIAIDIKPESVFEHVAINVKPNIVVPPTKKFPSITIISSINIQIKTATGKTFTININPNETILYLKKQIYLSQDVSLDSQRIVYGGKQLEDHKRICDYNITDECTVHIILRLRGGMFHKSSSRADWVSLNYLDKMERGLSMLDYMKREASDKLFTIFEDFEEMLKTSRDDCEIDMIYELIRNIYIE